MKNIFLLILFAFIATTSVQAQEVSTDSIYTEVETPPQFPGGQAAMMTFIKKNLRYTADAVKNKIEGTAVVQFVVEKDGSITDIVILRNPGAGLGEEAARIISIMPNWEPGKQKNQTVKVKMNAPIRFKLSVPVEDNSIYQQADVNASFPGGQEKMQKFITSNLVLPDVVKKNNTEGKVVVFAIVEKNGQLTNLFVQEKLCPECDEEALRIIKSMPLWSPAILDNKAVRTSVLIIIKMD